MADARKQLMERTCAECGRPYIYHNHWTYKMTINEKAYNFCSWGCMRKREAEVQKEKEEKKGRNEHGKGTADSDTGTV